MSARHSLAAVLAALVLDAAAAGAAPRIRSFAPANGPPETVVRIEGAGFANVRRVFIGGAEAGFRILSPTSLQAAVPVEAATGPIVVSGLSGADTSRGVFVVEPRTGNAGIAVLDPAKASPGTLHWRFTLPRPGAARLTVLDMKGVRVRVLADGVLEAGPYERIWDGRDERGRRVASGLYYAVLEFEEKRLSRLAILLPESG